MKYVKHAKYVFKMCSKIIIAKPEWYILCMCITYIAYNLKSLHLLLLNFILAGIVVNKTIS